LTRKDTRLEIATYLHSRNYQSHIHTCATLAKRYSAKVRRLLESSKANTERPAMVPATNLWNDMSSAQILLRNNNALQLVQNITIRTAKSSFVRCKRIMMLGQGSHVSRTRDAMVHRWKKGLLHISSAAKRKKSIYFLCASRKTTL